MEGLEPPTLWFVATDSDPLSYIPRRTTGIEPMHDGATNHCLTTWLRPPFFFLQDYVRINIKRLFFKGLIV